MRSGFIGLSALLLGLSVGWFLPHATSASGAVSTTTVERTGATGMSELPKLSALTSAIQRIRNQTTTMEQAKRRDTAATRQDDLSSAAPTAVGEADQKQSGKRDFSDPDYFRAAKAKADLRAAQSLMAFMDAAKLNDAQSAQLRTVVADFNHAAEGEVEKLVEVMRIKGQNIPPRDMIRFFSSLATAYLASDNAFQRILSPEQFQTAEQMKFDLLSQLDLNAFKSFSDELGLVVQEKGH